MRLPLLLLALVAACAVPPPGAPVGPPSSPPPGGLTAEQAAALRGLGIPVLVPGDAGAFALDGFEAVAQGGAADYRLRYRRADGACVEVTGTNDGIGGPDLPPVSTEARVADLGRAVRVHQAADDPAATSAQDWGVGTVISDFIDLDGAVAWVRSAAEAGCRPVSLAEGAAFVGGLVLLPAGGGAGLGAFAPADDVLEGYTAASSPEAVADAVARRYDGEADRVETRVLAASALEATALVTALGLRDDSVRDERLRLTMVPVDGTWELVGAARQVRCQDGRGHADWGPELCL